jgi:hypothetical protein
VNPWRRTCARTDDTDAHDRLGVQRASSVASAPAPGSPRPRWWRRQSKWRPQAAKRHRTRSHRGPIATSRQDRDDPKRKPKDVRRNLHTKSIGTSSVYGDPRTRPSCETGRGRNRSRYRRPWSPRVSSERSSSIAFPAWRASRHSRPSTSTANSARPHLAISNTGRRHSSLGYLGPIVRIEITNRRACGAVPNIRGGGRIRPRSLCGRSLPRDDRHRGCRVASAFRDRPNTRHVSRPNLNGGSVP